MTESPHATTTWPPDVLTLAIDVGGSGLKGSVLDMNGQMIADRVRFETPYPCPPRFWSRCSPTLKDQLPAASRALGRFPRPGPQRPCSTSRRCRVWSTAAAR